MTGTRTDIPAELPVAPPSSVASVTGVAVDGEAAGVLTVADAAVYIALTQEILGAAAVTPARFRIGASGILSDIEAVLAGGPAPAAAAGTPPPTY